MRDIHQFQTEPTHKISLAVAKALSLNISPVEHLSNDHVDHPSQHENIHKQCDETGHPVVNMMETETTNMIRISLECLYRSNGNYTSSMVLK